ncbi:MAG: HD domain-containing protein, partial [Victivallaceae bacterium]|nr:HD domain-containing protein [Victivallaceae bacterium]
RKIISLDFSEKHFIYDDIIIDHDHSFAAEQLRDFFEYREISRISFHEGTPAEAIIALLDVLDNAPEGEKRRQLNERLKSQGFACVSLQEHIEDQDNLTVEEGEFEVRIISDAKQLYMVAVDIVKEIQTVPGGRSSFELWKIDYLVNSILHHVKNKWYDLPAMSMLHGIAPFQYTHPVNVCIQSVYLGVSLLDDTVRLQELGRAAFLHDCSLLAPEHSDEIAEDAYERHAMDSARIIDADKQIEKLIVVCAYEHHLEYAENSHINLFSSIIAACDTFDRILDLNPELTPEEALESLVEFSADNILEPDIVNAFIDMIGSFPLGSIVKLPGGELAWVRPAAQPGQLSLKVCADRNGLLLDTGKLLTIPVEEAAALQSVKNAAALLFYFLSEVK